MWVKDGWGSVEYYWFIWILAQDSYNVIGFSAFGFSSHGKWPNKEVKSILN